MSSKPSLRTTNVDLTKKLLEDKKKTFGILRRDFAGITTTNNTIAGITGQGQAVDSHDGLLKISGDTMIGPLAFWNKLPAIADLPTVGNNNTLNVSNTSSAYSSHVLWGAGGSNTMEVILGATFSGQILVIESTESVTQTIVDESNTVNGSANIKTLDGNDLVLGTRKMLVLFMFSSIDNSWHQISNPIVAGAGGDNLGNHIMTQDLLPNTDAIHDIGSNTFRINEIRGVSVFANTVNASVSLTSTGSTILGDQTSDTISFGGRVITNIDPNTDATRNLGQNTLRWNQIRCVSLFASTVSATTSLTSSGSTFLGDTTSDTISFVGRVNTDFDPDSDATRDMGSGSLRWANVVAVSFIGSTVNASVSLTVDGSTFLGNSVSDTITFTGRVNSDFDPNANGSRDMGASGLRWAKIWATGLDVDSSVTNAVTVDSSSSTNTAINIVDSGGIIKFDGNAISVSASAGFVTLPSNPVAFLNIKVGGTNYRVPYYNT